MNATDALERIQQLNERCEALVAKVELALQENAIEGWQRFLKALRKEQTFIQRVSPPMIITFIIVSKLLKNPLSITPNHLNGSGNLDHFETLFDLARRLPGVVAVYKEFRYQVHPSVETDPTPSDQAQYYSNGAQKQNMNNTALVYRQRRVIRIDIVGQHGLLWVRVRANRKYYSDFDESSSDEDVMSDQQSLSGGAHADENVHGSTRFPLVSDHTPLPHVVQLCQSLNRASLQNPLYYRFPLPVVWFTRLDALDESIISQCERFNCRVLTGYDLHTTPEDIAQRLRYQEEFLPLMFIPEVDPHFVFVNTLNFDVSSIIALVSDVCHERHRPLSPAIHRMNAVYSQYVEEQSDPLLKKLFILACSAQRIIICRSAFDIFANILFTLGGISEIRRAASLFPAQDQQFLVECAIKSVTDEQSKGLLLNSLNSDPSTFSKEVEWFRLAGRFEIVEDQMSSRFVKLAEIMDSRDACSAPKEMASNLPYQVPTLSASLNPSRRAHQLSLALPKISKQHLAVFGTGDTFEATTITANKWVTKALTHVDACGQFDVRMNDVSIWVHPSRSLFERRQDGTWRERRVVFGHSSSVDEADL